jgi:hypothetical protein
MRFRTATMIAATALGLVLVCVAAAAPAPPRFIVPDMSPGGGVLPQDLAIGDFTNDGKQDVAVANLGPDAFNGDVAVVPGDGSGNLGVPIVTKVGAQEGAQDISNAVDFDGNGKLDLAVQTGNTGGAGPLMVLLGNGAGSFAIGQQMPGGVGHVEAGDLTGDGKADIVFVSMRGVAIARLFPGNGNGTFAAPIDLNIDFDAYDIELGDVNGDGKVDLVGAAGGPIWTMLQQPGGLGPQQYQFLPNLSGIRLTLGDFTLDGKLDVAVLTGDPGPGNPSLQIGRGSGNGEFTPVAHYEDVTGDTNSGLAAGDWTGDGKPDLVVGNTGFDPSNVVALLRGRGNGKFSNFTFWITGNDVIAPANLNNDGKLDLVANSSDPGQVYGTVNAGNGGFKAPKLQQTVHLGAPATGDVNNDGRPDLVMLGVIIARPGVLASEVVTHLGRAGGRFSSANISPAGEVEVYEGPSMIVLADMNEDGKLDIVAAMGHLQPNPVNIWVMLGRGDGTFQPPLKYRTGEFSTSNLSLAVADVTRDGHLDVVAHAPAQGWQLAVLAGKGDGTFDPQITSGSVGPSQGSTLVADFTGDGLLDVVAIIRTGSEDFGSGDVLLERGNGDGTFTHIQALHVASNPHGGSGHVSDLNGDTRPDVVFSGSRGTNGGVDGTWVVLNQGGTLAAPVLYPRPWTLGGVADFDLDGDVDLVGGTLGALMIRLNDGTGSFPTAVALISPEGSVLAGDFTGDKRPDLLVLRVSTKAQFGLYRNVSG